MKHYLYITLIVLFLLISCAPTKEIGVQKSEEKPMETPFKGEPPIPTETAKPEEKKEIPADIKEVLEKGKIKLSSYSYNYKSPLLKSHIRFM